jgi:hypothetical protein
VLCTGLFDDEKRDGRRPMPTCSPASPARGLIADLRQSRPGGRARRASIVPCAGSRGAGLRADRRPGDLCRQAAPADLRGGSSPLAQKAKGGAIARDRICADRRCDPHRYRRVPTAFGAAGVMVLAGIHAQDLVEAIMGRAPRLVRRGRAHRPGLCHAASGVVRDSRRESRAEPSYGPRDLSGIPSGSWFEDSALRALLRMMAPSARQGLQAAAQTASILVFSVWALNGLTI